MGKKMPRCGFAGAGLLQRGLEAVLLPHLPQFVQALQRGVEGLAARCLFVGGGVVQGVPVFLQHDVVVAFAVVGGKRSAVVVVEDCPFAIVIPARQVGIDGDVVDMQGFFPVFGVERVGLENQDEVE